MAMPRKFCSYNRAGYAFKPVNSPEIFDILITAIAIDTLDD
jgi:hypothetical protein